jgi:type I restriction enzyme M protein
MRPKREVLGHLKRDELLVAVDRYGLEVPDRRVREGLVDVLAGSRRAGLAEILGDLPRLRLEEICRELRSCFDGGNRHGSLHREPGDEHRLLPAGVVEIRSR